ncbi:MAG: hypothetical protein ACXVZH_10430, partial [Terriglobales bacterium]
GTSVAKPTPSRPAAGAKSVKAVHRKTRVHQTRAWGKARAKAKLRPASAAKNSGATTKPVPKSVVAVKASAKPSPAIAKGETQ